MMSGLRPIHSVETITWVSERSGIASRGVFRKARMPRAAVTRTTDTVRTRFRAHHAIQRSIIDPLPFLRRRLEAALRSDQKIPGRHDALARLEARDHLDIVPRLGPQRHLARGETAVPEIHEHEALVARVED